MELLGDVGHVECCFGLIGDRVSIGAREVHGLHGTFQGSEIVLDAPDGTPSGSTFWSVW
jgi:hypothetical protein